MKLISLDIWDTLITRDVHPEQIKFEFAQAFLDRFSDEIKSSLRSPLKIYQLRNQIELRLAEYSKSLGLNGEYKFKDVIQDLLRLSLDRPQKIDVAVIDDLELLELKIEKSHCLRNTDIDLLIAQQKAEQIILISDFYHSAEFLAELLKNVNSPYATAKIYSSCEYGKNKHVGDLFKVARADFPLLSFHTHIGDNATADVSSPAKLGISTLLYSKIAKHAFPSHLDLNFKRQLSSHQSIQTFYSIFPSFIDWINWVAKELGHEQIYFCAREGYFFDQLQASQKKASRQHLKSEVLEISRISTYLASRKNIDQTSFNDFFNQYPDMTWDAFCKTLGVDPSIFERIFSRLQIDLKEPAAKKVNLAFADTEFCETLKISQNEKIKNLRNYFSSVFGLRSSVLLVDIGWRGSIVDNLAEIFPEIEFCSLYLGLYQNTRKNPANHKKYAFLFNQNVDFFLNPLYPTTPFEMLTSSSKGSLISYGKSPAENTYRIEPENQNYRGSVSKLQTDILEFQNKYLELAIAPISFAASQAQMLIENPSNELVELFHLLKHDESFGHGRSTEAPIINIQDTLAAIFISKKREALRNRIKSSAWPAASLKKSGLHFLLKLKRRLVSQRYFKMRGRRDHEAAAS